MEIATLLFTYNRSYHTEQVISSLKQNTVLPQKLLIFQDGVKQGENICEWEKVNALIHGINWCDKEIIVSEYNKGLASSIVSGVNYAFREYDAVIVLEDDCVAAVNYIRFMQQCFEKYRENKRVYSVSGYNYPVKLEKVQSDVYGCGRISSWGWGTWKDRWEKYNRDNGIIARLKADKTKSLNLATWGNDLEAMLLRNIEGTIDSWAVYWALNVIENEGICIYPYDSLIQNIGFDSTGTNCGISDQFKIEISGNLKTEFHLPDEIDFLDSAKEQMVNICGNYTAVSKEDDKKEKVLIYGLGNFYRQNEKEINERYNIRAFVDRDKRGWYAGKKIISLNEIGQYENDKIIIMVYDIQECINIVRSLIAQGINYRRLLIGRNYFGDYSEIFSGYFVLPEGCSYIENGDTGTKISKKELDYINEVFAQNQAL